MIDLSRINKALHAGFAGGVASLGTTAGAAYLVLPAGLNLPGWIYAAVPAVNFVVGFGIGFAWTYLAPANTPALPPPVVREGPVPGAGGAVKNG